MSSEKTNEVDLEVLKLMVWLRKNYTIRLFPDNTPEWYDENSNCYMAESYLLKLFKDAKH